MDSSFLGITLCPPVMTAPLSPNIIRLTDEGIVIDIIALNSCFRQHIILLYDITSGLTQFTMPFTFSLLIIKYIALIKSFRLIHGKGEFPDENLTAILNLKERSICFKAPPLGDSTTPNLQITFLQAFDFPASSSHSRHTEAKKLLFSVGLSSSDSISMG